MKHLSIAIVTKNRPQLLFKNLSTLVPQAKKAHIPISIFDNTLTASARHICSRFQLSYVHSNTSIPAARNQALTSIKTNYLLFIDDDCRISSHYCQTALQIIATSPQAAYIVGHSSLSNPSSLVAEAQYAHYQYWFHQGFNKRMKNGWNLDTKNCILNLFIIKKHKLQFDTNISINGYDSSDTDFGFQLAQHHLHGLYEPKLRISHQEVSNLQGMCKKAFLRGRLAYLLNQKWHLTGNFIDIRKATIGYRLKQLNNIPDEYRKYISSMLPTSSLRRRIFVFTIIQLFEECYFQGFQFEMQSRSRQY